MKTESITISFQKNEITIRRNGSDTFIGEVASAVMSYFHKINADTFAKRFYAFHAWVAPIIGERTGITYIHNKGRTALT